MPKLNERFPKYSLHKASGQAVVTLNGNDCYLGVYGSDESRQKYRRLIAEWLAAGRQIPPSKTEIDVTRVNQIVAPYWEHAKGYYRKPDGTPTQEVQTLRQALKPVIELYGNTPATEFGPMALKAVRETMIEKGWCRSHINKQVSRIKSMFRWAAEQEMVPGTIFHALLAVKGLKPGRSEAPEGKPVRPVPDEMINAIQTYVSRQVWAMVQLQLLTAARPGEIVNLRPCDIDQSEGDVWACRLTEHKTAHHGLTRTIYLGPKAQEIIRPFLEGRDKHAWLFSPKEAEAERRAERTKARGTPESCGNTVGSNRQDDPEREPGDCYDVGTYRRAIQRACINAFPPPAELKRIKVPGGKTKAKRWENRKEQRLRLGETKWAELLTWEEKHRWHPHQLRHNAATRIRRERGLDAARAVLGHRSHAITEVYAEIDQTLATQVARTSG